MPTVKTGTATKYACGSPSINLRNERRIALRANQTKKNKKCIANIDSANMPANERKTAGFKKVIPLTNKLDLFLFILVALYTKKQSDTAREASGRRKYAETPA